MNRTVAPPGYWDKAAQRVAQAYQGGELLYHWRLEDLWVPRNMQCFGVEMQKKPHMSAKVYFLEGHWLAAVTIRNAEHWLWRPREHPELAYSDYLKALRLAERHLQHALAGLASS